MAAPRKRPSRYELALVAGPDGDSTRKVADHYGISLSAALRWLNAADMVRQRIPLEDKLLMVELYYKQGVRYKGLLTTFQDEIPILTKSMIEYIIRPRHHHSPRFLNYEEACTYHKNLQEKLENYYETVDTY